jgi:hypothetical protein
MELALKGFDICGRLRFQLFLLFAIAASHSACTMHTLQSHIAYNAEGMSRLLTLTIVY